MVVKHGDESHDTIRKKNHLKNKSKMNVNPITLPWKSKTIEIITNFGWFKFSYLKYSLWWKPILLFKSVQFLYHFESHNNYMLHFTPKHSQNTPNNTMLDTNLAAHSVSTNPCFWWTSLYFFEFAKESDYIMWPHFVFWLSQNTTTKNVLRPFSTPKSYIPRKSTHQLHGTKTSRISLPNASGLIKSKKSLPQQNELVVEPTHLNNIHQIGLFPQAGVKRKIIWNHHLEKIDADCFVGFFLVAALTAWRSWFFTRCCVLISRLFGLELCTNVTQ